MKNFIKEFRDFSIKGNLIDMAIGIIIGGAFGKIVNSLVTDIIMPPLGMLIGGVDFKDLSIVIKKAQGAAPAVAVKYGVFINTIFEFLIIAFSIFLVMKAVNKITGKKEEAPAPAAPPEPTKQEKLLEEIRDILKEKA
ncbi:MAG: large-conductance mechanosensitive channel protein MscL [Firmicutes bacterium]|nr:large-conductance mechanosensitive channel protein MscL [Bacillota bacterium]